MHRYLMIPLLVGLLAPLGCSDDDSPSAPQAPSGSAMTLVAADRDGEIYVVNPSNGSTSLALETSTKNSSDVEVDVGVVSSMLYVPQTGKWWLGTGGNAECSGCVQTLDAGTGLAGTLNASTPVGGISGLTMHPTNGKIYSFESDASGTLYEINANTGVFSEIHNTLNVNSSGKGTTFSNSGALYVAGRDHLFRVDPATGNVDDIGTMSLSGFPAITNYSIGSLTTRTSDGAVFGILMESGGSGPPTATYLVRVNLATAQVTNIGNMNGIFDGLAYVPTSLLPR